MSERYKVAHCPAFSTVHGPHYFTLEGAKRFCLGTGNPSCSPCASDHPHPWHRRTSLHDYAVEPICPGREWAEGDMERPCPSTVPHSRHEATNLTRYPYTYRCPGVAEPEPVYDTEVQWGLRFPEGGIIDMSSEDEARYACAAQLVAGFSVVKRNVSEWTVAD